MAKQVKTINGLMKHLRAKHAITIGGSSQKQKLRNIGYFHGFKGYRYHRTPNSRIPYSDFNEILAVNEFDMALKSLFYQQIMFLETALKNYVLEIVLEESNTDSFNDIFTNTLTEYKSYQVGTEIYRKHLTKRLDLRNQIYTGHYQETTPTNSPYNIFIMREEMSQFGLYLKLLVWENLVFCFMS